jgi:hypothetical protein
MEVLVSGPMTLHPFTLPCRTVSGVDPRRHLADVVVDFESLNLALYQEWIEL